MWAIVAVTVHMLVGLQAHVVTDAGTFESEDACKAEIAKSVPSQLNDADKKAYGDGELKYVCVSVIRK